jgi:uncharacterized protein (DUF2235 family)
VKNIVLCFDHAKDQPQLRDATNARALFRLLDHGVGQVNWYHPGTPPDADGLGRWRPRCRRAVAAEAARATIVEAYRFLAATYERGDAIYLFGAGRGAYCAGELARLLGVVGLGVADDDLLDYLLATYALPRSPRTDEDWRRIGALAAGLAGDADIAVPVRFLGLFDAVRVPGTAGGTGPLPHVVAGRHAVAIDGGFPRERQAGPPASPVEEVWFRGAHCDIAGAKAACWPLADIALDWMLDGAVAAGLAVREDGRHRPPGPSAADALAGSTHALPTRTVPEGAAVHASVEVYLRSHPQYWRRLPARLVWADVDWLARGERLIARPAVVGATQAVDAGLLSVS